MFKTSNAKVIKIDLKPFQVPLFESRCRYPAGIMGWGTGKTMVGILRGILQSVVYPNNLGLIVRRKFTDLRDSTIKDFTRYTRLDVPLSTKEVRIPGTDSVIMFRHGDELSTLLNINLGWFLMEQAEEFDSADNFDMLRGRLRRELEIDKAFKATGDDYKELIEWLQAEPRRIGMLIANAGGHNWIWRRWIKGGGDIDYKAYQADSFQNKDNLPIDFIKDLEKLKVDNPRKYNRYVLNSHEEIDIEGAYYAAVLELLGKNKRIGQISCDNSRLVHVVMDVGYHTAIWFFQIRPNLDIAFIRCYEVIGGGVQAIVEVFDNYKKQHGYYYGQIFAPCDVDSNAQRAVHGDSMLEAFEQLNYKIEVLQPEKSVMAGIDRTNLFLHHCWFDAQNCEIGLEALSRYRATKNETMSTDERPVFDNTKPQKDWECHLADAMRYASIAIRQVDNNKYPDSYLSAQDCFLKSHSAVNQNDKYCEYDILRL